LALCTLSKVAREEIKEGLHLGIKRLDIDDFKKNRTRSEMQTPRLTFLVVESSTVETRRLISLRIALAATPVVAVLKSM
jgi:hypothetical protein